MFELVNYDRGHSVCSPNVGLCGCCRFCIVARRILGREKGVRTFCFLIGGH
jgi:hypothetical protein